MKAIFYKDWQGKWTQSKLSATEKNFNWIKKHKAENGVATIQEIVKKKSRK